MEAKTNTLKKSPSQLATKLAAVTFLGIFMLSSIQAQAVVPSRHLGIHETAHEAASRFDAKLDPQLAQKIVDRVYTQSDETIDSLSLAKAFSAELRANGYSANIILVSKHHGRLKPEGRLTTATLPEGSKVHPSAIVRLRGGYHLVDPTLLPSTKLVSLKELFKHQASTSDSQATVLPR